MVEKLVGKFHQATTPRAISSLLPDWTFHDRYGVSLSRHLRVVRNMLFHNQYPESPRSEDSESDDSREVNPVAISGASDNLQ
ncbi:hypothetical protein DFQ26_000821, partial [Actinomortierella ambigua]